MTPKKNILIICTGNSCRSQMAEGFAREAGWQAYSAGIKPEKEVNPYAVKVMDELGIDISNHIPNSADNYLAHDFDIIITVCDNARENCPIFTGKYKQQIHYGFCDPADATGNDKEITQVYRRVRDEIKIYIDMLSEKYCNNN